jgi:Fe-S cluster biogenesis protein NfuA
MQKTKEQLVQEVERVLDTLREGIVMHSGNVELVDVDVESGKVSVRLKGACVGCPMSEVTLKSGIEETLLRCIPEISEVVEVA